MEVLNQQRRIPGLPAGATLRRIHRRIFPSGAFGEKHTTASSTSRTHSASRIYSSGQDESMSFSDHKVVISRRVVAFAAIPALFRPVGSPMYIAEARFAVRGADSSSTTGGLAAMFLPSGASVGADAHIVAEYIQSPDIMEAIDGEMGIFEHFSSHDHDPLSRLAAGATRDERLTYWKWAVKPSFDPETGIIALSVKAYDPVMAKRLAEACSQE